MIGIAVMILRFPWLLRVSVIPDGVPLSDCEPQLRAGVQIRRKISSMVSSLLSIFSFGVRPRHTTSTTMIAKRIHFFTLVLVTASLSAQTPFSLDSAAASLRTLAVEIGPRPMGSPNEQRALLYAQQKFREFGLQASYIMPISRAKSHAEFGPVNTTSGVAVGVLSGKTGRIIVIGGHIDSSGPDIPGANDDGSGSAVVLELARVLAKRENESTIVFALFGGEEQGLVGSRYFVENFPDIDKVVLMLQVDMANGSDWLVPFIDAQDYSAPVWLVKAAYEELAAFGYRGLSYPTHFFALNNVLPGGGASSDHLPFLERGIPAIDFTSDINDPIHTPQDSYENFTIAGLKRSGDLVYRLVERFDSGVPEETTDRYFLYEIGSVPVFIPMILVSSFTLLAVAFGIVAYIAVRRRVHQAVLDEQRSESFPTDDDGRAPGLKLFVLMLIIQSCVWFSENVVGLIKGLKYPWWGNLDAYLVLALFGGLIGIWLALQLTPRLNLSTNPLRYFLRALVLLVIFVLFLSLASSRLAFYPAWALFFLSLAMLIRHPLARVILWLLSAHFMFYLFFSEGLGLWAHALASSPRSVLLSLLVYAGYVLFFSLWSFPFLLGFVAIRLDSAVDLLWLTRFRQRWGGVLCGSAFALMAGFLVWQPSFTDAWKQIIYLDQSIDGNSASSTATLRSNENLDGTVVNLDGKDSMITSRLNHVELRKLVATEPWVITTHTVDTTARDSLQTVSMRVRLISRYRPYTLKLSYRSLKLELTDIQSPFVYSSTRRGIEFRWHSFPDSVLEIPVRFSIAGVDSLEESIEATFVQPASSVRAFNSRGTVLYRSTWRSSARILQRP